MRKRTRERKLKVPISGTIRLRKMLAKVLAAARPSLEDLAREVGVSLRAMQSYAKGKRAAPPAVIKRLAAALRSRGGALRRLADQLERQARRAVGRGLEPKGGSQ